MKQQINKQPEVYHNGPLDHLLLITDLSGKLLENYEKLAIRHLSELSMDFTHLLSSNSPYSLDLHFEGYTYRVRGRQIEDRLQWHFTDISDLVKNQCYSHKYDKDHVKSVIGPLAHASPASGAYPECQMAKDAINLRMVFEETRQYIALFDENIRITYCNQHYIQAVYDNEGFYPKTGDSILDKLNAEQRNFWYGWFERVRRGEEVTFEVAYRGNKGDLIYLDTYLKPLMIDGRIRGIIQFTTNITDKKQLDHQLIETEERLRMATEAAHIGVFDWHEINKELIWDERQKEMFCYDKEHFISEIRQYLETKQASGLINLKNPYFRLESVMPTGKEFKHIESYGRVIYDENKQIERIVGVSLDFTAFRRTEIHYRQSKINLKAIFDSSPNAHFLIDRDFSLLSSNKVGDKLIWDVFHTRPNHGDFFLEYVLADYRDDFIQLFDRALQTEAVERLKEFNLPNKGNRWFKLIFKPAYYEQKMVGVIFSAEDHTEQITAKKENERLLNIILSLPTEVYLINEHDYSVEFVNEEVVTNLQWTAGELKQKKLYDLQPRLGKKDFVGLMKDLNSSDRKKLKYKTQQQRKDGSEYSVDVYLQKSGGAATDSLLAFVVDTSEQEKIQKDLREIEHNYKLLIDNVPGFVTLLNKSGQVIFKNQAKNRQSGRMNNEHDTILEECRKVGLEEFLQQTLATESVIDFESKIESDTTSIWFVHHLVPIIRESSIADVMMISTEITAQKNQELQLRHSIEERDTLLKEIHHRVKNNLQIISSMLYLKSNQLEDTESRKVMEECNQRIRSMHMIHELLLQEQNLSSIDPDLYLQKLIQEVYQTFRLPEQKVQLECNIAQIQIGANKMMTMGMIIYELLSNALRFAFVGRDQGKIRIQLTPSPSALNLCVIDDGIGLPEDGRWKESLGILLLKTFATQIKARLVIDSDENGTRFCIEFNDEQ